MRELNFRFKMINHRSFHLNLEIKSKINKQLIIQIVN